MANGLELDAIKQELKELNRQKNEREEMLKKIDLIKKRKQELKELDKKLHPRNYQKLLKFLKSRKKK